MKILVTGGAGFIGKHCVQALLDGGHSVRVLDDFSGSDPAGIRAIQDASGAERLEILEGDIATSVTACRACEGMDGVIHLAARVSVPRSIQSPLETYHTNVMGLARVLDASRLTGVSRLVLASSCAVYGHRPPPCSEHSAPDPLSPYAASKLAGEALVAAAAVSHGLRAMSLRFFNVYGPGQSPDGAYAAVIPKWIAATQQGQSPLVFGDGSQTRDFVYVGDVVRAILAALAYSDAHGQVVNIGSGVSTTLLQLADELTKLVKQPFALRFEPARSGEVVHSRADTTLARDLLGFEAATTLQDGLRAMLEG